MNGERETCDGCGYQFYWLTPVSEIGKQLCHECFTNWKASAHAGLLAIIDAKEKTP